MNEKPTRQLTRKGQRNRYRNLFMHHEVDKDGKKMGHRRRNPRSPSFKEWLQKE